MVDQLKKQNYKKVLLLATKFTMEDGFFSLILEKSGIEVKIPDQKQRDEIHKFHRDMLQGNVTEEARHYFQSLIQQYKNLDAVILGCTEFPLVVDQGNSVLPIVDPVILQTSHAVHFALQMPQTA